MLNEQSGRIKKKDETKRRKLLQTAQFWCISLKQVESPVCSNSESYFLIQNVSFALSSYLSSAPGFNKVPTRLSLIPPYSFAYSYDGGCSADLQRQMFLYS